MILPEYTFRPMTRLAMVLERLAAESGHPAVEIVGHVGQCPFRNLMLRMCRSVIFSDWQVLDGEPADGGPSTRVPSTTSGGPTARPC